MPPATSRSALWLLQGLLLASVLILGLSGSVVPGANVDAAPGRSATPIEADTDAGERVPEARSVQAPSDLFGPISPGNFRGLDRKMVNGAFRPGEKFSMRVTYMGVTAGFFTVRVGEDRVDGRALYTLNMKARTAGAIDWFYRVRDTLTSYMDVEGLFSWGYDYDQNHGGDQESTSVRYDQQGGVVNVDGERADSVPRFTQDILSSIYYLRSQDLEVGQSYRFPVHVSDDYYELILTVAGVEKIGTYDGWKEAYRLVPDVRSKEKAEELREQVYSGKHGGVQLWISKDQRKIPLQVALPARFGTFYGYLEDYSPG